MTTEDTPPPTPRRQTIAETANQLVGAVGVMNDRLEATNVSMVNLAAVTRRSKRQIRVLAVSLVFDVLLSVGLAFALSRSKEAVDQNREAVRVACVEANRSRAGSVALWEGIAAAAPPSTPEQQQRTDAVLALVHQTYAPRDCR